MKKNINYIFFIFAIFSLTFLSSCELNKEHTVRFYDGNGEVIKEIVFKKEHEIQLYSVDIPTKKSDSQYDYYFKGWDLENITENYTVIANESMDIKPLFDKYQAGLCFSLYSSEDAYSISKYIGDSNVVEIPEYVGYPIGKNERITKYLPVKSIGISAFSGNEKIEKVIMPNSIEYIYDSAFSSCSSLEKVDFPKSLITLYDRSFSGCINLKEVTFSPDAEVTIKKEVFSYCQNLKTITLPNSLTTISEDMFYECVNLEKINYNGVIKRIERCAFFNCSNLDFDFLDFTKLEYIGAGSFNSCYKLPSKLDLSNLTELKDNFNYCISLEEVVFNKDIAEIYGFNGCPNLKFVNLNELHNLKTIKGFDKSYFECIDLSNCKQIEKIYFNSEDSINIGKLILYKDIKYRPLSVELIIMTGEVISSIKDGCEYVELPNDMTYIKEGLFIGNTTLKEIVIPKNVKSIENRAFSSCVGLESLFFEEGSLLTSIGDYAFNNCIKLKNHNLDTCSNLEFIGMKAFYNCYLLTNIKFNNLLSLQEINDEAFYNTNIRTMILPDSVKKLGTGLPNLLGIIYLPTNISSSYNYYNLNVIYLTSEKYSGYNYDNVHFSISLDDIYEDDNGFVYLLKNANEALIAKYCGVKREVITPEEIVVKDIKYEVTGLGKYCFGGDYITSLTISNSIRYAETFLFNGVSIDTHNYYTSIRMLSVGLNFNPNLIYNKEYLSGLGVKNGTYECWESKFSIINSYKDRNKPFNNRYAISNLIFAESKNTENPVKLGMREVQYAVKYETYPRYKEFTDNFDHNYFSSLNDPAYDIKYEIIDGFIFDERKIVCLGYIGEYQNELNFPEFENGYSVCFYLNKYHCASYTIPDNVILSYK